MARTHNDSWSMSVHIFKSYSLIIKLIQNHDLPKYQLCYIMQWFMHVMSIVEGDMEVKEVHIQP